MRYVNQNLVENIGHHFNELVLGGDSPGFFDDLTILFNKQYDWRIGYKISVKHKNLEDKIFLPLALISPPFKRPEISYFVKALGYENSVSISFQPMYNYEELDITHKKSTTGGIVFNLPVISVFSPEIWLPLAHEVGHLFIGRDEFIELMRKCEVNDKVHNWLKEVICDIFALKVLGPSYLIGFIFISLLDETIYSPFNVALWKDISPHHLIHPTNLKRFIVMGEILHKNMNIETEYSVNLINVIKNIGKMEYEEYYMCQEKSEDFKKLLEIERIIDDKINELEAFVDEKIIDKLKIHVFSSDDYKASYNLSNKYLKEKIPIGTYLDKEVLKSLQEVNFDEIESELLNNAIAMLEEEPVTVGILSNAFQIIKLRELVDLEKDVTKASEDKEVLKEVLKNYEERVRKRDELFLKSLEIIEVYNFYKKYEV